MNKEKSNKEQVEEIRKMLDEIKLKCYLAKVPFAAVVQFHAGDNKDHRIQIILTPEAVEFKGDTRVFYDITNVMNGKFKTVITSEYPDDDGTDESAFYG